MKQEGSICEYLRAFEILAASLKDIPKQVQESTFINGLKLKIRAEVRMMILDRIREVVKFGQYVEERNACRSGNKAGSGINRSSNSSPSQSIHFGPSPLPTYNVDRNPLN